MPRPTRMHASALLFAWTLFTLPATAQPQSAKVQQCLDASDKGQVARDEGKLLTAREQFVLCASADCPVQVHRDCTTWVGQIDARIPTIVVSVRDRDDNDVVDARVFLDSRKEPLTLGGAPIRLDPGAHKIRLEPKDQPAVEQTLVVRDGEQNRLVTLRLGGKGPLIETVGPKKTPEKPLPTEPPPVPRPTYWDVGVIGGVGALGLLSFGLSTYLGNDEIERMRGSCAPRCAQDEVDAARDKHAIANVSLGVGLTAIAVAVGLTVYRLVSSPPSRVRGTGKDGSFVFSGM